MTQDLTLDEIRERLAPGIADNAAFDGWGDAARDMAAEAETRIQVATVQAMVKRIFMSDEPPPIDQFDCIIVDEAHRGYTLDLSLIHI